MTTLPELVPALDGLEHRRARLAARIARYPEPMHRLRPRANSWSLLEVAEHLMLSERATLRSIARSAERSPFVKRWRDAPLNWVIARALESAVRIPITGRILTPSPGSTLPRVMQDWDEVHESWRSYAMALREPQLATAVFRHPLGALMTPLETLIFLRRHFDHHLRQVERVERSATFTTELAKRA